MLGMATGKYTVIRGSVSTNDYGDEVSDDAVVSVGNIGAVTERRRTNFDPQSGRVATVRELTGRFSNGADIKDGDRIKDEKTGDTFLVASVYRGTSIAMKSDLVLDLSLN